jgi:alkylation response protein AidB-like acyl-CoA dehydrogenase
MATALTTGLMGVYLGEDAAAEVFANPRALSAGQVAPRGTAVREASGGVRVQGDFVFSSGSAHANWMMGGFREIDAAGEPVRLPSGMPNLLLALVPKSRCEMDQDWNVLGLEATGSVNYRIPEQVIGAEFVWPLIDAEQRRGGAIYRMGAFGLTNIAHSAFSVGVARRALQEIAAIAPTKKRAGRPTPLIEDPVFQSDYGMAEAALSAARAGALQALSSFQQAAFADSVTTQHRARARLASSHAARTAVEVVAIAHRFAGSAGLRNGTAINQCFRDISASEAHVFTDHGSWVEASAALLTGTASPFL